MSNFKVSILIPSYNHSLFIEETINSVLNQNYSNVEMIIIDDGSVDDSNKVINSVIYNYRGSISIRYISRENKGLIYTLNELIKMATGEIICLLASDDLLTKESISLRINDFNNLDVVASFGLLDTMKNSKNMISKNITKEKIDFEKVILGKNKLNIPGILIRTCYLKENNFPSDVGIEDFWLYVKMYKDGLTAIINYYTTCEYRYHENNLSKRYNYIYECKNIIIDKEFDSGKYFKLNKKIKNNSKMLFFRQLTKEHKLDACRVLFSSGFSFNINFLKGILTLMLHKKIIKKMKGH